MGAQSGPPAAGRRSWEFTAIPVVVVVLGVLAVIMLAFVTGLWAWLALGVVFLVGLGTVVLLAVSRPHHRAAASATIGPAEHVDDGVHRVLLVADDSCPAEMLREVVAGRPRDGISVFVVAPALSSRLARWTSDERAYDDARKHLEATLTQLRGLHVDARGDVGSHDPLQAADDGLRRFPADEIVFALHAPKEANWLEQGVVEAARSRYPLRVSELTVPTPTG